MSNEGNDRSLSGKFYSSAKDDPKEQQRRETEAVDARLEALGAEGEKAVLALNRQTEHMIAGELHNQVEATDVQRFEQKVRQGISNSGSAPEPGRETTPLSPAQYEQIKQRAGMSIEQENAEIEQRIRFEAVEARNRIGNRQADRMEDRQQGRGLDRGRDMGEGGL